MDGALEKPAPCFRRGAEGEKRPALRNSQAKGQSGIPGTFSGLFCVFGTESFGPGSFFMRRKRIIFRVFFGRVYVF